MLAFNFDSFAKLSTTTFTFLPTVYEHVYFSGCKFKTYNIKKKDLQPNSLSFAFLIFKHQLAISILQGCFGH